MKSNQNSLQCRYWFYCVKIWFSKPALLFTQDNQINEKFRQNRRWQTENYNKEKMYEKKEKTSYFAHTSDKILDMEFSSVFVVHITAKSTKNIKKKKVKSLPSD